MFDRISYKKTAKQMLKGHWKIPVLITLFILLISTLSSIPSFANQESFSLIAFLGSILTIIIAGILEIATVCFYLEFTNKNSETKFNYFLESLNRWKDGILGVLWTYLWTFLWSLLLFIPGIIKSYSYKMIFFILAENPGISVRKAMNMSKAMTKGFKWDLFVMDLSFVGWGILSLLTLGIGLLWLEPYIRTSTVYAYKYLKERVIASGVLTEADFSANKIEEVNGSND